jgi:hypothetical protein
MRVQIMADVLSGEPILCWRLPHIPSGAVSGWPPTCLQNSGTKRREFFLLRGASPIFVSSDRYYGASVLFVRL